jgi:hypothetical protein
MPPMPLFNPSTLKTKYCSEQLKYRTFHFPLATENSAVILEASKGEAKSSRPLRTLGEKLLRVVV